MHPVQAFLRGARAIVYALAAAAIGASNASIAARPWTHRAPLSPFQ